MYILFKADIHQNYNIFLQKFEPNKLALGGGYEKKGEEKGLCILVPGDFKVSITDLQIYKDQEFNFHENDFVYFNPTCTEKEIEYLLLTNKISIGGKYRIDRVINQFYVILQDSDGGKTNLIRFLDIIKK